MRFASCLVALWLLIPCSVMAKPQAKLVPPPAAPRAPVTLEARWNDIRVLLHPVDIKALHAPLQELLAMAQAAGYQSMPTYSEELLQAAHHERAAGRTEEARYLVREALMLSPESPAILFAALPLARATGAGSEAEILARFLFAIPFSPKSILRGVVALAYPCCMALTVGLFCVGVALLLARLPLLRRRLQAELPNSLRGYLEAPLLTLAAVVPLFYGPLITLAVWALLVVVLSQRREWFTLWVGAVLCLWGAAIPLRENSAVLLQDRRFLAMLEVLSGEFRETHRSWAEQVSRLGPEGGVEWYALGQYFERVGEFARAEAAFTRAEGELPGVPWPLAQRGVLAAARGDTESALRLLEEARSRGGNSAAVLFHLSQVLFSRSDTQRSREVDSEARRKDPILVDELHRREDALPRGGVLFASMPLPYGLVLKSLLSPAKGVPPVDDEIALRLTVWCTPVHLMGIGALFVLLFFVCGDRPSALRAAAAQRPSVLLRLIPGGSLVAAGRVSTAFGALALLLSLAAPLFPISGPAFLLWQQLPGSYALYGSVLGLFAFLFWYSGVVSVEE